MIFYGFQPTGLRLSIGHSVCKSDGPTAGFASLPGCLPYQFRLWGSRLCGFAFLIARCCLKQACAAQNDIGRAEPLGRALQDLIRVMCLI